MMTGRGHAGLPLYRRAPSRAACDRLGGVGGMSIVTQANVFQSNGVIHVVDTVVLPQ